jgi:hypothetical protein
MRGGQAGTGADYVRGTYEGAYEGMREV